MKNLIILLLINVSIFGQNTFFEADSAEFYRVENVILKTNELNRYMLLTVGTIAVVGLIIDVEQVSLISAPILLLRIVIGPSTAYYELGMKKEAFQRAFSRTFIVGITYFASSNILKGLSGLYNSNNTSDNEFKDLLIGIIGGGLISTFVYQNLYKNDIEDLRNLTYRKKSNIEISLSPKYELKTKSYGINLQLRF